MRTDGADPVTAAPIALGPSPPSEASISRVDAVTFGFGAMIGWGWVVLTGPMISDAGVVAAVVAMLLGGMVGLSMAWVYAHLLTHIPVGGTVAYVRNGLGAGWGWFCGWMLLLAYASVCAFEAVAFPLALSYVVPAMLERTLWTIAGHPVYLDWIAVGTLAALAICGINVAGIKPAAVFQRLMVLMVASMGTMLALGAIFNGRVANMQPAFVSRAGFGAALIATPFLFVGFDVIAQISDGSSCSNRNLGRLIPVSVFWAVVWYVVILLTVSAALPASMRETSLLATVEAAEVTLGGRWAGTLLATAGLAGILSTWNAFVAGGARIIRFMADEGMLPRCLAISHRATGTPVAGVVAMISVCVIASLAGKAALLWFAHAGGFGVTVSYVFTAASLIRLSLNRSELRGSLWTGIIGIALSLLLLLSYTPLAGSGLVWPAEWTIVGVWLAVGLTLARMAGMGAIRRRERNSH